VESIRSFLAKIKGDVEVVLGDVLVATVVILVGFGSFGLGRLSAAYEDKPEALFFAQFRAISVAATAEDEGTTDSHEAAKSGSFVASRNGSKYHFPWCSGAQSIKPENAVWFESEEAARAAGYAPAANCKGLK